MNWLAEEMALFVDEVIPSYRNPVFKKPEIILFKFYSAVQEG